MNDNHWENPKEMCQANFADHKSHKKHRNKIRIQKVECNKNALHV